MHHLPRSGAGPRTWIVHLLVAFAGASVAACTALLGDFDVAPAGGPGADGGDDAADGAGGGGDAEPPRISPETIKVGVSRPAAFNASGPVTWSVREGDAGGRIDATGHYVSPAAPGEYHVVATSADDPSLQSEATVTVVDLQLEIVAGPGAGQGTVDGLAAVAHFNHPTAIAYDRGRVGGNTRHFVADTGSSTIRVASGGVVRTLAGSPGLAGDQDGLGEEARFDHPTGIEFAPTLGKVLVADTENHCIREVDPETGRTQVFVGVCGERGADDGDAADARLQLPATMLLSHDESTLYVCGRDGGAPMRIVSMDKREVSTYAPAGGLSLAYGCVLGVNEWNGGGFDRVFFGGADDGVLRSFGDNDLLRTPTSHVALPNPRVSGFASDTGFGGHDSLYVAVAEDRAIYVASPVTAFDPITAPFALLTGDPTQTTYAARNGTLAQARFGRPVGLLHRDGASRMLVVDEAASAIRYVDRRADEVGDFLGKSIQYGHADATRSAARFALLTGVTIGPDTAYVTDASSDGGRISGTVRAINLASGVVTTVSGAVGRFATAEDGTKETARFVFPFDVVKDGEFLYVADILAHAIRRVSIVDGSVTTIAGSLNVAGDAVGVGVAAQFREPSALAVDGEGNLYVADGGNAKIKKIALGTGAVTLVAGSTPGAADGPAATAQFRRPSGLAFVGGALFVADNEDHTIRRIDVANGEVSTLLGLHGDPGFDDGGAGVAKLFGPVRLAPDGIGGLYVTEGVPGFELDKALGGRLRRVDVAARTIGVLAGRLRQTGLVAGPLDRARVNVPFGVATAPNGDVVFGDLYDYSVAVIKPL